MRSEWQRRIERAQQLRLELPASAEILSFYENVAAFQWKCAHAWSIETKDRPASSWQESNPAHSSAALAYFRDFLTLLGSMGPSVARAAARDLASHGSEAWSEGLLNYWGGAHPARTASPAPFIFLAYLQPYAEVAAHRLKPAASPTDSRICPVCCQKPGFAILRPMGDGGKRSLVCSFCVTEWEFRRVLCASCGEREHAKLPVFLSENPFKHIRVECCETCRQYLKGIDLTTDGRAEPLVDEIAAVSLDLWAQDKDYSKIAPNILGL